ncbi:MAG: PadR family transcriptional regulator [Candidatus Thorarchaeota archaeon]
MTSNHKDNIGREEDMKEILSDFSQFYILLLLSEEPNHGYALIKKFKSRTGKTLSAGTLYPFLQKLEDKGLVNKIDESVGKRPKKVYYLSEKGEKFCERLFRRFSAITASAIEPTLDKCASCGVRIFDGGYHKEVDGKVLAFCCPHCAAAFIADRTK